jgi:hypothetical protein
MPSLYKEGVFWLVLLAVTIIIYVALAVFIGPLTATAAFGLLGIAGLQPLLYWRRRTKGDSPIFADTKIGTVPSQAVLWDERDTKIAHTALIAGYSIFWLAFTLGIMGIWGSYYLRGCETISVHVLPGIVFGGTLVFFTTRAITIVVQYRLQNADRGE